MASERTPLFAFEMPTRERASSKNSRNTSAREVLRQIVHPNTSVGSPIMEDVPTMPDHTILVRKTAYPLNNPVTYEGGGRLTPSNEKEMTK